MFGSLLRPPPWRERRGSAVARRVCRDASGFWQSSRGLAGKVCTSVGQAGLQSGGQDVPTSVLTGINRRGIMNSKGTTQVTLGMIMTTVEASESK